MRPTRLSWTALDHCDPQLASYSSDGLSQLKNDAIEKVQMPMPVKEAERSYAFDASKLGSFTVDEGPLKSVSHNFKLHAPTARENAMRAVKGISCPQGYQLCRINLFDQTDLMNLFGSDPFVENGYPGEFTWKDNEFLTAVQEGHRFLLVEMSLAPQAIFEGVNAVLDLYTFPSLGDPSSGIPFSVSSRHRIHSKLGGGRKGLTRTFLDLFTKVYTESSSTDLLFVCRERFRGCSEDMLRATIPYNNCPEPGSCAQEHFWSRRQSLRIQRSGCSSLGELSQSLPISHYPRDFLRVIYLSRFRTLANRNRAQCLFDETFSSSSPTVLHGPHLVISSSQLPYRALPRRAT
ncbi:hypothetical protein F4604DRAFT_1932373 [Suillus subluteus]|nr:hypothetical protein F4604DRAFT_1939379 [Suillus subluteus]KAG1855308.1 hypothetical protein F4604DRAFT_1932373 [Suillus subluteus]